MIEKYIYGEPFETDAVVNDVEAAEGQPQLGKITVDNAFTLTCTMAADDIVYGLGENVRGLNKRGFVYVSDATDIPKHYEDTRSLYASHNFIILAGKENTGLFIDCPGRITWDLGYTHYDQMKITVESTDLKLYVINGDGPYSIVKQFRKLIGRSYIPPKFAFGFGQSRWGYATKEDFRKVVKEHREAGVPLDMVYMDIDYMQDFKDFTLNETEFADFADFAKEMKEQEIRLVPIIDAGVKIEKGYDVYEEGIEKGYFCKRADGSDFVAEVWPGWTHFPDVLNPEARRWFGDKYKILLDQGIEGFWNDMNEPSIFKTPESQAELVKTLKEYTEDPEHFPFYFLGMAMDKLANNPEDYARMYSNVNGKMVCHKDVHNLFGYNMTRAAGEAFERLSPDKRILMFSRSSYVGMHRYGGIWQGDNLSWWSHLLMNLKMTASLNMMGLLYTGADLGGFGSDTTEDLLLRWLALGVFTPLMRNHSAKFTREQEFYQFDKAAAFRNVIGVRYRLIPYLYSEFMKAALKDDMMMKPMAFVYPQDELCREIEDQMMIGNEIMIAPVYTQNANGRYVYLPEDMKFVKFLGDGSISETELAAGLHYVRIALDEVALFIRKGQAIPVADFAECVAAVDYSSIQMLGYEGAEYELYNDDGYSRDYENPVNYSLLRK